MYVFPKTNSGHHAIIAHAECEVAYVLGCCKAMRRNELFVVDRGQAGGLRPVHFEDFEERMGQVRRGPVAPTYLYSGAHQG